MTRGQGWRFLDMGRRLERALHTSASCAARWYGGRRRGAAAGGAAGVADSSMTYRRRYLAALQTAPVLDLLLADETNPRSLAFQLSALADHVERPAARRDAGPRPARTAAHDVGPDRPAAGRPRRPGRRQRRTASATGSTTCLARLAEQLPLLFRHAHRRLSDARAGRAADWRRLSRPVRRHELPRDPHDDLSLQQAGVAVPQPRPPHGRATTPRQTCTA